MSQYAALVVEKALASIVERLSPLKVPAKFEEVLVKEFIPEKVLLSERRVEEADEPPEHVPD